MLSDLGWRSLENRRTDTRLAMFYKIVYNLVAIPLPSYFEHPEVYTRHMHSLSYRQIHTSVCYYKYSFFRISIVLWNKLPADLVLVSDLGSFKTGVSKINRSQPYTVIHLQFWAYGSWDSLFPISMSPHCKLMSPKHYF